MSISILLAGVGGQGTVLASKLIASCAMRAGQPVHTAETIGMAQRGGSVFSHVRIGAAAPSPLIPYGQADVLIGFEPSEAVRALCYLKAGGSVIVSSRPVSPITATLTGAHFASETMISALRQRAGRVIVVDGEAICQACGSMKVLNTALLSAAAAAGVLGITPQTLEQALCESIPETYQQLNRQAFSLGAAAGRDISCR